LISFCWLRTTGTSGVGAQEQSGRGDARLRA
jgi:hypothetical protein